MDDAGLVARALAGDRSSWAQIWEAHGAGLHTYARRLLSDEHDAADAVADTFVSAAEHLADLRDPALLRPWLYSICRRHVQRRWGDRDRVRPYEVDLLAVVSDARQADVIPTGGVDAAEAADLLWAAAEGVGQADRDLLALALQFDLDSGSIAAATGESPPAVYVRVSRLKDALGRSAGALLVARHHREDCPDLDLVLQSWDGVYSSLWRKRIARHVDACSVCGDSRVAAAAGLFSLAALAPALVLPTALRDRVLAATTTPDHVRVSYAVPFDAAGWPETAPWASPPARRHRRALAVAGAAVLLGLAAVGTAAALDEDDGPSVVAVVATGEYRPLQPVASTLASPLASSPLVPEALAPAASPSIVAAPQAPRSLSAAPAAAPTRSPVPPLAVPSVAPPPVSVPPVVVPPAVVPPALAVTLALRPETIRTACGVPSTSRATAAGSPGVTGLVITWGGTAPGSSSAPGAGPHSASIGPYASTVDTVDRVTVTATATDAFGRTATASRTLIVSLAPC